MPDSLDVAPQHVATLKICNVREVHHFLLAESHALEDGFRHEKQFLRLLNHLDEEGTRVRLEVYFHKVNVLRG
jgi:hypothetical protein